MTGAMARGGTRIASIGSNRKRSVVDPDPGRPTMKPALAATLLAVAAFSCTAGTVQVRFVEPERYSDAGSRLGEAEQVRIELAALFERLGASKLGADRVLEIDVLDVDLAGEPSRMPRHGDPRIVRGRADWPRIVLRYRLRAGDQVLTSGQEQVQDLDYLASARGLREGEPLRYETRMLERWFSQRFGAVP